MMVCSSDLPEGCWLGDLTREHPRVRAKVISLFTRGVCTLSLVLLAPRDEEVLSYIKSHEAVREVRDEGSSILVVRHKCPLAEIFAEIEPPRLPFSVRMGRAEWHHPRGGKDLWEALRRKGLRVSVRRERERKLTRRQREILLRAIEEGYYDFPRRVTLSELAERLGISKSYLSETLMKVESKLLPEALLHHT